MSRNRVWPLAGACLCMTHAETGDAEIEMNELAASKSISAVPLNALRAFEIAARNMSLKAAARELNVTPSAVSHRLRLLEKRGARLFLVVYLVSLEVCREALFFQLENRP